MFENKRKNNWTYSITEAIKVIKGTNFLILLAILNLKDGGIFILVGILLLAIIMGIYKFTITKFYIKDNVLIIEKGSIARKKLELPFEKINTVDQEENIVSKIFEVCTLKVDSGANKLAGEEVKLQLTVEEALSLKDLILKEKQEENHKDELLAANFKKEKNYKYEKTITVKELFIYGLTKGKLLGTISFIFIVMGISQTLNEALNYDVLSKAMGYAQQSTVELLKTKLTIILFVILLLVGSFIAINIITIGYEAVRLYNFKVARDDKNIYISYGLIKTNQYTIALNKIHALKLKQSLIQQYFKLYTIEATAIGYGDEKNEKAIIFPIANKVVLNEIIVNILPSFKEELIKNKKSTKALKFDLLTSNLIYFLATIAALFILDNLSNIIILIIGASIISLNTISILMDYKNTSIATNQKLFMLSRGSFAKEINFIKQSSVQSVEVLQGPIARTMEVAKFKVNIYTNKILEFVIVDGIPKKLETDIISNMDM